MFFNEPSKLYLTKENNSKINGVVFELTLTYSLPIECHFNLADIISKMAVPSFMDIVGNYFPLGGLKI